MRAREWLYELVESVTAARLTISHGRVGGVKADLHEGFEKECRAVLKKTREVLKEVDELLTGNRIFHDRMRGIGVISAEDAIAYGITGPFLRSTGGAYDVRKAFPYFVYDRFEFDVPVGEHGDNYSRYLVRMEEMQQAIRSIEQALDTLPEGPTNVDPEGKVIEADLMADLGQFGKTSGLLKNEVLIEPTLQGSEKRYHDRISARTKNAWLPPKEEVYSNIEALMHHFKAIMLGRGLRPPQGEVHSPVEGPTASWAFTS